MPSVASPRIVGSITSLMMRACIAGRDHRRGRVRAHAAGVGAVVAVVAPLVILRRRQRQDVLAVRHHDEAGFLARQEFLDDDLVARVAELPGEHRFAVAMASVAVSAMTTPLPAARPLALTTIGRALPLHILPRRRSRA